MSKLTVEAGDKLVWNADGAQWALSISKAPFSINPRKLHGNIATFCQYTPFSQMELHGHKKPIEFWRDAVADCDTELFADRFGDCYEECKNQIYLCYIGRIAANQKYRLYISSAENRQFEQSSNTHTVAAVVCRKDVPGATNANWKKLAREIVVSEMEALEAWMNGDVFSYELFRKDPSGKQKLVRSDSGFYGSDTLKNGIARSAQCGLEKLAESRDFVRYHDYTVDAV